MDKPTTILNIADLTPAGAEAVRKLWMAAYEAGVAAERVRLREFKDEIRRLEDENERLDAQLWACVESHDG